MLVSFVLISGANNQRSHVRIAVHHPLLWGTVAFSAGHLLANNRLADLILFGGFGVWALIDLMSCYQRDRAAGMNYPQPNWTATLINLVAGVVVWYAFARWVHLWLFGVSPLV
jgi:uncharacterized membrane protein